MTDESNSPGAGRVQKFTASGGFVSKWGSPGFGDGQFNSATGVDVDAIGRVFVTELGNRVQAFTADGAFLCKWGSAGSGDGQFNLPNGLAIGPSGGIYVSDTRNYRVQKFGDLPTATRGSTWGRIKTIYR